MILLRLGIYGLSNGCAAGTDNEERTGIGKELQTRELSIAPTRLAQVAQTSAAICGEEL